MAAFDSFLTDKYISNLMSASPSHSRSLSSTQMSTSPPNLQQFVESVPPPITLLLVELSSVIRILRRTLEVVSWEAHWSESWLMLATWWATCLLIYGFVKYMLPVMLMLPAFWAYLYSFPHKRTVPTLTTEQTLATALTDIDIIRSLLPSLPQSPESLRSLRAALRVSVFLFIPYAILTYFVPLKILIGIVGTLVLISRATWAQTIRAVLGRSASLQRAFRYTWVRIVGPLNPVVETSTSTSTKVTSFVPTPSEPQRFLFTILECQRWWVGLDWTAALLPGERPSWCNVAQQPVSPPGAFELPCSSTFYLPGRNAKRIKRTATWCWEDPQWGIIINKDGIEICRLESNPPGIAEEEDKDNSSRLKRAATLLRERSINAATEKDKDKEKEEGANHVNIPDAEDVATDADGWVYGDNKWEATTSKGGLGKYTRYRRWTRVAILKETVEEVGPGELGIVKDAQLLVRNNQVMKEAQAVVTDIVALANTKTPSDGLSASPKTQRTVSDSVSTYPAATLGSQEIPDQPVKSGQGIHNQDDSGAALRERLKSAIRNTR